MNDPLSRLLGELADGQPAVADWPGRVRTGLAAQRRRQRLVAVLAAVAVLAVGGVAVRLAADSPTNDGLVIAADPSPSPSPTATTIASPSASSPAHTPETSASGAPAPVVQPQPTSPGSASQTAMPPPPAPQTAPPKPSYPSSGTQVIEITAQGRPERPQVGQEYILDVTVTGSADKPYLQEPCYDSEKCLRVAYTCAGRDENYSPPPPQPQTIQQTFRHRFTTPGRHEIELNAESACSYYGGYDTLVLVVMVDEQPASPQPSPGPTA